MGIRKQQAVTLMTEQGKSSMHTNRLISRYRYGIAGLLFLILGAGPTTAPVSGPFAGEINAFLAADEKQMPPAGATLFVGSSSIRFWSTLKEDFPKLTVINRGFGGSQISDSTFWADRIVIPYHPARVVLYAGDNDVAGGKTPEQILAEFQAFVAKVRTDLPDTPIYFISIKPSPSRWHLVETTRAANGLIADWIKGQTRMTYVDVFNPMLGPDGKPRPELYRPDKLHMTRAGYEIWTKILTPMLTDGKAK